MASGSLNALRFRGALIALVAALLLIIIVQGRSGDEVIACSDGRCSIGSGRSWILTGVGTMFPFATLAGWAWTSRLRSQDRLGPFSPRRIPDIEEMAEVLSVLAVFALAYLVVRSGAKMPILEAEWPNSWLEDHLGDRDAVPLVPSRTSWFIVGLATSAPFGFAFGTAVGREWFAWRLRAAR